MSAQGTSQGPDLPGATPWQIPWSPWSLSVLLLSYCPQSLHGVFGQLFISRACSVLGGCCDTRSSDQQEVNAAGTAPGLAAVCGSAAPLRSGPSAWAPLLGPLCSTCLPSGLLGRELAFSLLVSLFSLSSLLSPSPFLSLSLPFSFLYLHFFFFFFFHFYPHPSLGAAFNVKTLL